MHIKSGIETTQFKTNNNCNTRCTIAINVKSVEEFCTL